MITRLTGAGGIVLLIMVEMASLGCDNRPHSQASSPAAPATAPTSRPDTINFAALSPQEPTPVKPGFLCGRIVDAAGKPLKLPKVRFQASIAGVLDEEARSVVEKVPVTDEGTFVMELRPGTYSSPSARVEFAFNDTMYRLPLIPLRSNPGRRESSEGISQDFTLKLSGLRSGALADKAEPSSWFGGAIYPEYKGYRADLGRVLASPPLGTKVVFTLTPKGPLADGSTGDPIVIERLYNPAQTALSEGYITDIPLGRWEVQAVERYPAGGERPLLFLQSDGNTWKPTVLGTFQPNLAHATLEPVSVLFTRQER